MTILIKTHREISKLCHGEIAVVMTMGALHKGHAELMRVARECVGSDGTVVVTVFVNPTQFGAGEDFTKYPRTLEVDFEMCAAEGVDIVYAPDAVDVYGTDDISALPASEILDGGRCAAGPFRRHADGGEQITGIDRGPICDIRREGLPAVSAGHSDVC